jgi:LacI family transcriptional regulator
VATPSYDAAHDPDACNSRELAIPGPKATVREIASETGVSIATVSRVLNGQAHVAPHTRSLVMAALERRGGQAPEPRSAHPRRVRPGVYVRCPYVLTDYFGLIVSSVAQVLDQQNIPLILNAGEAAQRSSVLPGLAARTDVGGAILILPPETGDDLVALRADGFPFVVIDPRTQVPRNIASVSAAHFAGARAITAHLIELGHRRIGVIGGPPNWLASDARLTGHTAAMAEAGVLPSAHLVRATEATIEHGYRAAQELLDLADPPTALVGFSDKSAVGALRAASDRGLQVPGDLSVTGFDDIDLSQATNPMLTTVRQPLEEMGRMAVSLLRRLMSGHEVEALHIELATELVLRGSTGPVRATR